MQGEQAEQACTCMDNGEDEQEGDEPSKAKTLETENAEGIKKDEL